MTSAWDEARLGRSGTMPASLPGVWSQIRDHTPWEELPAVPLPLGWGCCRAACPTGRRVPDEHHRDHRPGRPPRPRGSHRRRARDVEARQEPARSRSPRRRAAPAGRSGHVEHPPRGPGRGQARRGRRRGGTADGRACRGAGPRGTDGRRPGGGPARAHPARGRPARPPGRRLGRRLPPHDGHGTRHDRRHAHRGHSHRRHGHATARRTTDPHRPLPTPTRPTPWPARTRTERARAPTAPDRICA